MPLPKQVFLFLSLTAALLVLPQCAEKSSQDYVRDGIEQTQRQEYSEAMESFLKAIEKDSRNAEAYVALGGIYNQKNMFAEAAEAFDNALQLDPTHVDAYYSLGFTQEMMGNMEEAEKNYQKHHSLKKRLDDLIRKEREKP